MIQIFRDKLKILIKVYVDERTTILVRYSNFDPIFGGFLAQKPAN